MCKSFLGNSKRVAKSASLLTIDWTSQIWRHRFHMARRPGYTRLSPGVFSSWTWILSHNPMDDSDDLHSGWSDAPFPFHEFNELFCARRGVSWPVLFGKRARRSILDIQSLLGWAIHKHTLLSGWTCKTSCACRPEGMTCCLSSLLILSP